jgi:ankyrin repeat protein
MIARMNRLLALIAAGSLTCCSVGPLPAPPPPQQAITDPWWREGFPTDSSNDLFPLDDAIRSNRIDEVKRLLEGGENPNLRWGQGGDHFPLEEVLEPGYSFLSDPTEVVRLLLQHGADPNAKWCPFESRGSGPDPFCINEKPSTALMYAAGAGESEIVRLLLEAGADPLPRDWQGISALDVAANAIAFEHIARAMFPDVSTRDDRALEWIRDGEAAGTDGRLFNRAISGSTWYEAPRFLPPGVPDWRDAERPIVDRLQKLLDILANPNDRIATSGVDWPPLATALMNNSTRGAAVLLRGGADVNARWCSQVEYKGYKEFIKREVGCTVSNGMTALMLAASKGNRDAVEMLLASGAKASLKDWAGHTALDYATTPAVRALLQRR